jgi:hypothetical protein
MEVRRDGDEDAKTARDRALGAIVGADFETQRSLWRAALRYNERMKVAGSACDYAPRLPQVSVQGDGVLRK